MEKEKPAKQLFCLRTTLITFVAAIIRMFVGLFFYGGQSHVHPKTRVMIAKNMIHQMDVSIAKFKMDYDQFPWPNDAPPIGTTMADILRELAPTNELLTKGKKPTINTAMETYFEIARKHLKNGTLVDPWGNEYMIGYDEMLNGPSIWSKGPNGIDEMSDGDEDYGDDIFNVSLNPKH